LKLKYNPQLKEYLWEKHGIELFSYFEDEIRSSYQFIFETGDYRSLWALESTVITERIELYQACLIESMIQLGLNGIFSPLEFKTELPSRGRILILSAYGLGYAHSIIEDPAGGGFLLQRIVQNRPEEVLESVSCKDVDQLINTIAGLENEWKSRTGRS
jgi:hypothetical protein